MGKSSEYWFKRRRYGWGWTPTTWQGWAIIIMYLAIVIGGVFMLRDTPDSQMSTEVGIFMIVVAIATAFLVRISITKGPKPKWRHGKKDTDDPNEDF
jgi:uncharacterized membrane protein